MRRARDTLFALLITTAGAGLVAVAAEELLVADAMGRFDVAMRDQGVGLAEAQWSSLPPAEALAYFRRKRILTAAEMSELEDAYRARGFTVAGLQQRYALERVHSLLCDAIEKGTTKREFVKAIDTQFDAWGLTRLGRHHIETVFDTNVLGAYAAGRFAQMTRPAVLKARPYWQYKTAGDTRVRPAHQAMHDRVFRADNPVWDTWYPPNGFRCRCGVVTLSQADVHAEGLVVEEEPPRQVEVGTQVHQVIPDRGFSGSPRTQARADAAVERMRKQVKRLGLLRAPELTRVKLPGTQQTATRPASPPVHASAGDLLRTEDARRNAKVDQVSGLSAKRAEQLAAEQPFFNVFPRGQLGKPGEGETWVESALYSQNLDTAEQVTKRLAQVPRMGHLAERLQVAGRASYGAYDPGRWPDPEVAHDAAAAARLGYAEGTVLSRSTELVLRVAARSPEEASAALSVLRQMELGQGSAVRRAWQTSDLRVRGAAVEAPGLRGAFLCRRKMGSGEQVVLTRGGPIPGWKSEQVHVNEGLWEMLPDYSGGGAA